jgi:hypothetical protein
MFIIDGYAVLIGIDDYSAYDKSRALPKGTSNLAGSLNDVKVWWRQCRLMGLSPAHIRVLTSPAIEPKDLDGARSENLGPATEAEIKKTLGWLAQKLAQPSRPTGLLTYSGHGDWLEGKGSVLCPSDVAFVEGKDGAFDLAHAISYADVNAIMEPHSDNLTVVLDCCHTGGARDGDAGVALGATNTGRPLSLTWRPAPKATTAPAHATQLAGRVLSASQRSQIAYQSKFDGMDRGVFSWSLTSAMEQWRAVKAGRGVCLDVSYGKLVETSKRLMDALWFPQTPALHGPPHLGDLAVLQQGLAPRKGQTTPRPDAPFRHCQLDTGSDIWRGITFTFNDPNLTPFATVIMVNTTQFTGFSEGKEYWWVNLSSLNLFGSYALDCASVDHGSSPAPSAPKYSSTQAFTQDVNPSGGWGSGWTTDPVSGGYLFSSWALPGVYLRVKLSTGSGSPTVSNITWYQVLSSGSPANLTPAGHMPTASSVYVGSGYTGYDISQGT